MAEEYVPGDDWDLADEVEQRKAITANDDLLRAMPYPRFTPKGCSAGAHYMRRDTAGLRTWVCTNCGTRRPFNVNGDQ